MLAWGRPREACSETSSVPGPRVFEDEGLPVSPFQQAWKSLAEHLNLAEQLRLQRVVNVDASTLKRVTHLEPRLLMKFDSRAQRPAALAEASIFPVRNGLYSIVACDAYHDLEYPGPPIYHNAARSARQLITLPWGSLPSSESQVLDMALASGMLGDFLQETGLALTIRGRLRCPAFSFCCQTLDGSPLELSVDGVQTEVDAGLEGQGIHLIEAKLGGRTDFHVRQLYYPLRMWSLRAGSKPVTALFCCYSDRLFHFWQYVFEPLDDYHGIRLLKSASYSLENEERPPSLAEALASTRLGTAPVPFPQADNLGRLIDLVEAVASGLATQDDLSLRYDFTIRQAAYYANAARFLGLLSQKTGALQLSPQGVQFAGSGRTARHAQLIKSLAQLPVFRPALEILQSSGRPPSNHRLAELIRESTELKGSTVLRRAGTVAAWLRWVDQTLSPPPPQQQLLEL